ncbi:MAG: alcohol dehydrogenase catalytic domain-containing protein [Acidimicrobiia bacterium]
MGHEFIGVVEDIGAEVHGVRRGDLVRSPPCSVSGWRPRSRPRRGGSRKTW